MRLHVYQPTGPPSSSNDNRNTRIVVSDSPHQGSQGSLSAGCAKLRLKLEIYPISRSNYFHIVVQLLFYPRNQDVAAFDDFGDERESNTMDTVELLFLAESGHRSNNDYQSPQRGCSDGNPAHSPPPLGEGAFVELTVGGELFVVNVLAENKPSRKEEGMGQNHRLGLRHLVIVKVSKKDPNEEKAKVDKGYQDAKGKSASGGWLRHFPPLRRAVTDDGSDGGKPERKRKTEEPLTMNDPFDSPTRLSLPSPSTTKTSVALQSWRVKSISSHGTMPINSQQMLNDVRGPEATIVAHGREDSRVSRGVLINF